MEKKNDNPIITDRELLRLIEAAKQKDTLAMLKLIELYKEDIVRISNFIYMPTEDAISAITLEFLESILKQDEKYDPDYIEKVDTDKNYHKGL
ncbi:hypothetical protein OM416_27740 [Paenibacillus sp. LS1]|uniref:hypothetical protein n=1 Tax=Paenibacillus sp. LS1 TaxID=2992120 RepID=UPI002231981C|nr:hypothetical protein [Paenibacillus sp. LS1]MCW3795405.1 hypothetical protein [Paenibacillus sp. LS1]